MSFVKVGLGRSQRGQGKRPPVKSKKAAAPKREWVSTVADLSVHKLTPEELSRRREMYRSQNRAVAQWELRERDLRRRHGHAHPHSPAPLDATRRDIIREVFSEQLQLQDVLARSDRAMAVVKDLFGDAPRRQTGFPSVTMAPDCGSDSELPVRQRAEPPTQLSLLSQSMMDAQALNELEGVEDEDGHSDEETEHSAFVSLSSNMDTHRGKHKWGNTRPQRSRGPQQRSRPSISGQQGAGESPLQTPCGSRGAPDPAALNATVAVQRLRSRQRRAEQPETVTQVLNPDPSPSRSGRTVRGARVSRKPSSGWVLDSSSLSLLSGNQSSLALLQGLLGQVEAELDCLGLEQPVMGPPGLEQSPRGPPGPEQPPRGPPGREQPPRGPPGREQPPRGPPGPELPPRGPPGPEQPPRGPLGPQHSSHSLTGFSVALVSTLSRLARLHRQREEEAQEEARERRRLEEEVKEQRGLIDALSAETLALREENAALLTGLQEKTFELEQTLDTVVLALGGLGVLGGLGHYGSTDCYEAGMGPPPQPPPDTRGSGMGVERGGFLPPGAEGGPPCAAGDPQCQAALCPAVLLSPPRQRDTRQLSSENRSMSRHQRPFLPAPQPGNPGYPESFQTLSPAPSLPSPPRPEPDSAPGTPAPREPTHDAMLAQIAELTRQNTVIRAQLVQARGQGSGAGSPREGAERRGSSSGSTGRETPLSGLDRRASAPSSTDRVTPQSEAERDGRPPLSGAEHQRPQQAEVSEGPCVSSVEQRLLELNRQSAAARSRLLELIEQQKLSTSVGVSPSVSPIPPHTLSPASARSRTPESSMLLPESNPSPQPSEAGRGFASGVFPECLGGEKRGARPQVDVMKGEGWFALSTHVR